MKNQPIPLINGFYADETRPWSQQDVVNWLPCAAEQEGTRTPTMLKTPPGLSPFVEVSASGQPVRGVYNAEGRLFTVMGSTLYQIRNGVAIPLGTIPGVNPVRFSHNQITNGNEVLVVNGSAGYIWNTVTQTLTRITDPGYPGAIDAVFIDGYFIQIEPARRFAFNSDLADGLNYNTLDRFTSEVSPDLLVGMAVSNNELLLLSEGTGEFFENTGAAEQPFRSKRITFDKGAASRYGIATLDNTVMWLGSDGVFYLLDGYSPRRISTRPIEQMIRGLNWANAFAFVWEDSGHSVCYWTFPDGQTIGYDASQQKWHRRASYGLERWRPSCMARWQNLSIAGDFQAGRLWELDWAYPWEGDVEFISEMTGPVLHDDQNLVQMPRLEVIMDTGMPEVATRDFPAQPDGPAISGTAPDGFIALAYTPYDYTLTAGDNPIVGVTLRSGAYPAGMSISSGGTLSGTPTEIGSFTVTLRVTDSVGLWAEITDTIVVATVMYATTASNLLSLTQLPYDWTGTVNVGASVSGRLVESRQGKVLAFYATNNGASVSSNAGSSWTACSGLPSLRIVAHVYAGGKHILVPESGTNLYTAADGQAFSPVSFAADDKVTTAAYASGDMVIVARSNSSQSRRSTDGGATWANCPLVSATQIWAFASSGTSIMAVSTTAVRRSTDDGATWSSAANPIPASNLGSIAYGDGRYIVVNGLGQCATSTDDGVTFTASTSLPESMGTIGEGNEFIFDGENFVAACITHVYTSPTGQTWTQRNALGAAAIAFYRSGQNV